VPADELRIPWALMVSCCAGGAWAIGSRTPASAAAGAALLVPGVLLALAAVRALGRPRAVVTAGPYRWVRHPYLLAVLLLLLGAIVALRAWAALVLFLPAARLTVERARREEHNLRLRFPEGYERYARMVQFMLPLGPPMPKDRGSRVVVRGSRSGPVGAAGTGSQERRDERAPGSDAGGKA
jgi:protein-S-isoprenylcysteine O-methyltransferase Ste14